MQRLLYPIYHSAHTTPFIDLEELPVRLAHRVKELDELPHDLSRMPSIKKVKNWYAQSFEVCESLSQFSPIMTHPSPQELINFSAIQLSPDVRQALAMPRSGEATLPESIPNPTFEPSGEFLHTHSLETTFSSGNTTGNGNGFNKLRLRVPMERR